MADALLASVSARAREPIVRRERQQRGDLLLDCSVERSGETGSVRADTLGPLLSGNCTLHHIGFVVASISEVAEEFAASVSAQWDGRVTHDPLQRVRVAFFCPVDARNPIFELVEPADQVSPVRKFLKRGGGFHHVCYEIDDLNSGLRAARETGLVTVSDPAPAVAFSGRRIAWVCSKSRLLVELLER
jgi:methylmalonyl-CoA/ethylmalonyl-CoA epimerase